MLNKRAVLMELAIGVAVGIPAAAIVVAEGALHIKDKPDPPPSKPHIGQAGCETVGIRADDGVSLEAWLLTPPHPNGSVVTLLHGVGDSRQGMLGYAHFLLHAGFAALMPDARGHGASGGTTIGYGFREAGDLVRWQEWLAAHHPEWRQYGLGVSMGAAILLQALAQPTRFHAVVAESSFANMDEVACDRLAVESRLPVSAVWPIVQMGMLYARARYGLDLKKASPLNAIRSATVPVLLIHGANDVHIPLRHSQELQAANPKMAQLWTIPCANHVECFRLANQEYKRRVLDWFSQ